eukprot:GHVQ01013620.1.p1 GENE.GHVQ01013620.1~~GHVQ01013620.1.p1  ORF type:complete len:1363 (+),score=194.87 GHVQ01013620.1:470-4558(+)
MENLEPVSECLSLADEIVNGEDQPDSSCTQIPFPNGSPSQVEPNFAHSYVSLPADTVAVRPLVTGPPNPRAGEVSVDLSDSEENPQQSVGLSDAEWKAGSIKDEGHTKINRQAPSIKNDGENLCVADSTVSAKVVISALVGICNQYDLLLQEISKGVCCATSEGEKSDDKKDKEDETVQNVEEDNRTHNRNRMKSSQIDIIYKLLRDTDVCQTYLRRMRGGSSSCEGRLTGAGRCSFLSRFRDDYRRQTAHTDQRLTENKDHCDKHDRSGNCSSHSCLVSTCLSGTIDKCRNVTGGVKQGNADFALFPVTELDSSSDSGVRMGLEDEIGSQGSESQSSRWMLNDTIGSMRACEAAGCGGELNAVKCDDDDDESGVRVCQRMVGSTEENRKDVCISEREMKDYHGESVSEPRGQNMSGDSCRRTGETVQFISVTDSSCLLKDEWMLQGDASQQNNVKRRKLSFKEKLFGSSRFSKPSSSTLLVEGAVHSDRQGTSMADKSLTCGNLTTPTDSASYGTRSAFGLLDDICMMGKETGKRKGETKSEEQVDMCTESVDDCIWVSSEEGSEGIDYEDQRLQDNVSRDGEDLSGIIKSSKEEMYSQNTSLVEGACEPHAIRRVANRCRTDSLFLIVEDFKHRINAVQAATHNRTHNDVSCSSTAPGTPLTDMRTSATTVSAFSTVVLSPPKGTVNYKVYMSGVFPHTDSLLYVHHEVFGFPEFRGVQLGVVNATLLSKDTFVIMSTGAGKSHCYQLPIVWWKRQANEGVGRCGGEKGPMYSSELSWYQYDEKQAGQLGRTNATGGEIRKGEDMYSKCKVALVVSPLLSLIEDQLVGLRNKGIRAEKLTSDTTKKQVSAVLEELVSDENGVEVLFATPERISNSTAFADILTHLAKTRQLKLMVVDEAHCVSQWGIDFRRDYRKLGMLKKLCPGVPLMALTASATPQIIKDAKEVLNVPTCILFQTSVNRPNLWLEVRSKSREIIREMSDLIESLELVGDDCGIVYCLSTKECEAVADKLRRWFNISAEPYHAKLAMGRRKKVQQAWMDGSVQVVVATIAFGLGIDKPNVRFVFHHSMPQSIDRYYQEIGRAGRDGLFSRTVLWYSHQDVRRMKKLVTKGRKLSDSVVCNLLRGVDEMEEFCTNVSDCRRERLLQFFGETVPKRPGTKYEGVAEGHISTDNSMDRQTAEKGLSKKMERKPDVGSRPLQRFRIGLPNRPDCSYLSADKHHVTACSSLSADKQQVIEWCSVGCDNCARSCLPRPTQEEEDVDEIDVQGCPSEGAVISCTEARGSGYRAENRCGVAILRVLLEHMASLNRKGRSRSYVTAVALRDALRGVRSSLVTKYQLSESKYAGIMASRDCEFIDSVTR